MDGGGGAAAWCGRGAARPSRWTWTARSGWWWWRRWTRSSSRAARPLDLEAATATVRKAINDAYQLRLHDLVFLKAGSVPKTSSGKIQRQAAREAYLERGLQRVTEEAA